MQRDEIDELVDWQLAKREGSEMFWRRCPSCRQGWNMPVRGPRLCPFCDQPDADCAHPTTRQVQP